jgi:hypothetical protein
MIRTVTISYYTYIYINDDPLGSVIVINNNGIMCYHIKRKKEQ